MKFRALAITITLKDSMNATAAAPNPSSDFASLEEKMEEISDSASRGCGLHFELFEQALYRSIDQWIEEANDQDRSRILALASSKFDYSQERPSGGWNYDQETNQLLRINHEYVANQCGRTQDF